MTIDLKQADEMVSYDIDAMPPDKLRTELRAFILLHREMIFMNFKEKKAEREKYSEICSKYDELVQMQDATIQQALANNKKLVRVASTYKITAYLATASLLLVYVMQLFGDAS